MQKPIRVSPGLYRDPRTNKIIPSQKIGSGKATPKPRTTTKPKNNVKPNPTPPPSNDAKPTSINALSPTNRMFSQEELSFLFPSTNMQNDKIYQNSLRRGTEELNRKLAAAGLTNSGRDIEMTSDLVKGLESDAQDRYAKQNELNADRYYRSYDDRRNFDQRQYEYDTGLARDYTRMALDQNPAEIGRTALNSSANMGGDVANKSFGVDSDNYDRVTSRGGGSMPTRQTVGANPRTIDVIKSDNRVRNNDAFWNGANNIVRASGFTKA